MFLTRRASTPKDPSSPAMSRRSTCRSRTSGLIEAQKIIEGIEGIRFVYFTNKDGRAPQLVQQIIKAYERHEGQHGQQE